MAAGKLKAEFKKFLTVGAVTQKTHGQCGLWKLLLSEIYSKEVDSCSGCFQHLSSGQQGWPAPHRLTRSRSRSGSCVGLFHLSIDSHTHVW